MAASVIAPFAQVQHLLDQAALVSLYAAPKTAGLRVTPERFCCRASLQRFESVAAPAEPGPRLKLEHDIEQALRSVLHGRSPLAAPRFTVRQQIGESAGALELECVWGQPAGEGPRRFTVNRARFTFGEIEWVEGSGAGRLYPASGDCQDAHLLAAVGKISKASGKLDGLAGTFALNGRFDENIGFEGVVACRFFDPCGRVRTHREIEAPRGFPDPVCGSFLELRVASGETGAAGIVDAGEGRSLLTAESGARAARFVTESRGYRGLESQVVFGRLIGTVETEIELGALNTPPGSLPARYRYRVAATNGECAGTLDLTAEESVVIELPLAGQGTRVMQFAGAGRIGGGTGVFEESSGVFVENSALALRPPALSLMQVTQLAGAVGRFRAAP